MPTDESSAGFLCNISCLTGLLQGLAGLLHLGSLDGAETQLQHLMQSEVELAGRLAVLSGNLRCHSPAVQAAVRADDFITEFLQLGQGKRRSRPGSSLE